MHTTPGQSDPSKTREVLDSAVRRLAVSRAGLLERLYSCGAILIGELSREDLADPEDRELFDQIRMGLVGLGVSGQTSSALDVAPPEGDLEAIANEILDLRDTIMGRAIREAAKREEEPLDWIEGLDL
ncbi:MAG TPA: hypothetical protein VGN25_04500 [Solirubrobacteraceae bacterium]|jgi:hypothetical protein|nr:hypothetical protein [Solirubrobacteraceae bacterium]